MNASLEPTPVTLKTSVMPLNAPAHELVAREGILEVPGDVSLYHGGRLPGIRIAWRVVGPANAPVVCALGGISANRRVCLTEDPRQGWWSEIVGLERPLDARRFRILSFDYVGGSGDSTGPCDTADSPNPFPCISSYDQAEALVRLLNHLGLKSLRAIAGGSYGGMVALAFGERYPERVGQLIVIGAADRPHPMATAWRSVQRRIVRFGLDCGRAKDGLQLARALAMATYRSPEEFGARFGTAPISQGPISEEKTPEGRPLVFPVEQYLFARGSDWATRYRPESFLCLSESIDLHCVDAGRVFVPTTAVAIREDQLVPLADMRALVARLPTARLHEISSIYGHDAFLKESDQLRGVFFSALGTSALGSSS
jgi:homoserine O-acetyltransferase